MEEAAEWRPGEQRRQRDQALQCHGHSVRVTDSEFDASTQRVITGADGNLYVDSPDGSIVREGVNTSILVNAAHDYTQDELVPNASEGYEPLLEPRWKTN